MGEVVIVRYGEIGIKGAKTRRKMEELLASYIKRSLEIRGIKGLVSLDGGRIYIWKPSDIQGAIRASLKVFGVKSVSPAHVIYFRSIGDLVAEASMVLREAAIGKTIVVRARRAGRHDFTSKDVERLLGAELLRAGAAGVNLESPQLLVNVEVRGEKAFIYTETYAGPGGIPPGSDGKILLLFSGGLDSAVAAWRLMKRGASVHLLFYDLGFPEARSSMLRTAMRLYEWGAVYGMRLYTVDMREAVMRLIAHVSPEYRSLLLRRLMMEHAQSFAREIGAEAIATGESLGQVSSQTLRNLRLISQGIELPIIRPLIGYDKEEIVLEAMRIGIVNDENKRREVCGMFSVALPAANPKRFIREMLKLGSVSIPRPMEVELSLVRSA